jgi:hypothetical protein
MLRMRLSGGFPLLEFVRPHGRTPMPEMDYASCSIPRTKNQLIVDKNAHADCRVRGKSAPRIA